MTTVHSYHINVDHGDSAIHLLINTTANPNPVLKAVLIDGGKPNHAADIRKIIRQIRSSTRYDFSAQGSDPTHLDTMSFDSIVITHWDIDHWGGIGALLHADLAAQLAVLVVPEVTRSNAAYQASKTGQFGAGPISPDSNKDSKWNELMKWIDTEVSGATSATWDTVASARQEVALKSRFMKYPTATTGPTAFPTTAALVQTGSGVAPAVTDAMLLTTFYCPYSYTANNVGTAQTDVQRGLSLFRPTWGRTYVAGSGNVNMMTLTVVAPYTLQKPNPKLNDNKTAYLAGIDVQSSTPSQRWNVVNVCRLRADSDSYLGMEIFNNVSPPTPYAGFTTPAVLANSFYGVATSNFRTQRIGLFIVSGDQVIVGGKELTLADTPPSTKTSGPWATSGTTVVNLISNAGASQIHHKAPLMHVINTGVSGRFATAPVGRTSSEEMNSPSIGCIVLSGTPASSGTTVTPNILHFTAGDALYDTEASIAGWMTDDGTTPINIPVMKLSHHGASESTPLQTLHWLNPRHIISSNGQVGSFGHPRSEVICALLGYFGARTMASSSASTTTAKPITLWCTNYPYWLKATDVDASSLDFGAFLPTTVQLKYPEYVYHAALDTLFSTTNALNNVWQKVNQIDFAITDDDRLAGPAFVKGMKGRMLRDLKAELKVPFDYLRASDLTEDYDVGAICVQFDTLGLVQSIPGDGQSTSSTQQEERKSASSSRRMTETKEDAKWVEDDRKKAEAKKAKEAAQAKADRYAKREEKKLGPNAKPRNKSSSSSSSSSYKSKTRKEMEQATDDIKIPDVDEEGEHNLLEGRYKRPRNEEQQGEKGKDKEKGGQKLVRLQGPPLPKIEMKVLVANGASGMPAAAPNSSTVYICGSILTIDTTAGAYGLDLNASADFNAFLNSMRPLRIGLATTPTADGVSIDPDDEWFNYLQSNTLGINSVKLSGTIATKIFAPSKLEVGVQLAGIQFTFSSASTGNVMSASGAKAVPTAFNDAIDSDQNVLVLGLQTAAASLTTSQILDIIDSPWLNKAAGLPVLGNALTFRLDPAMTGSRCALFLSPLADYPTTMRLGFKVDTGSGAISDALKFLNKNSIITFGDTHLYCVRSVWSTYNLNSHSFLGFSETTITLHTSVLFHAKLNFDLWLHFKPGFTQMILTFDDVDVDDVLDYLANNLFDGLVSPASLIPMAKNLKIRRVTLNMDNGASGFKLDGMSLTMQIDAFGGIFFTTFSWPSFYLDAVLWTSNGSDATLQDMYMIPDFETYQLLTPLAISGGVSQTDNVSLTSAVIPSSAPSPPQSIGTQIKSVRFAAWKDTTGMRLSFQGSMSAGALSDPGTPTLELGDLTILADRVPGAVVGASAEYSVSLSTTIYLFPRNYGTGNFIDAAKFTVTVLYDTGNWTVSGSATDLQFALLFDLFDADSQGTVMDVMEQISIPYIECIWQYRGGSSTLHVEGALLVHTLELKLAYDYDASNKEWTFQAQLGSVSSDGTTKITIVDLIRDFDADSEVANKLEEVPFIRDIAIPTVNTTPGSFEDAPIQLVVSNKGGATVMWFQIEIDTSAGKLSFLFVQYQASTPAQSGGGVKPGTTTTTTTAAKPKRLLRIRLDSLPALPYVPITGQIKDPVDSIEYILVRDVTGESQIASGGKAGFTLAELMVINKDLHPDNQLRYRDVQSSANGTPSNGPPKAGNNASTGDETAAKTNYVLLDGHHFIVVANDKVILDHLFGGQKGTTTDNSKTTPTNTTTHAVNSSTSKSKALVNGGQGTKTPAASAAEEDSGSTMGSMRKTMGPLTIANFGLQCKDNHLWLLVDVTIALGPLQFTLIGFGIGIPLTVQVDRPPANPVPVSFSNLSHLNIDTFLLRLSGLSVYFNQPPVLIAGMFEKIGTSTFEAYRGGLAISISEYTVLAVGSYQHTFTPDFKSTFVFGRLDGPILTLEFAELSGLELGFGQNYSLTMPAVSEVMDFPLVHGVSSTNDPMVLLASNADGSPAPRTSFLHWTTPTQDQYWFALGLRVDSFQILTVDAAVVFAFGANTLKISLVGMASACFPPVEGNMVPPEAFLYAEFGVIATVDVLGGSFWAGAQLTPNSYVLCPLCHITGGFALGYWFYPSPTAGDFVFTIGGYHPAFKIPAHYPACERVGVSWQVSDCITAGGHAYFAITPKMAMAGGDLEFVFDASPFYASFTAWANFLFIFKPFFMIGEIGCSIEAGFHGSIGIIHFNIHAEVDADLLLQGPPWAGRLHIHLWIVSFNVSFGDLGARPPFIPWEDFLTLVQKPGPGSDPSAGMIVLALTAGNIPQKTIDTESKSQEKWWVRAGTFKCRLECKIPIDVLEYDDGHDNTENTFLNTQGLIYANPMGEVSPLTSTVTVKIVAADVKSHARTKIENPWILNEYVKNVPKALWDQYDDVQNPLSSSFNPSATLSPDSTISSKQLSRLVGYSISTPNPRTPESPATALKYNAFTSMSEDVFSNEPGHDENPVLNGTAAAQMGNLPGEMQRGSGDGREWDVVRQKWEKADWKGAKMFVDVWAQGMGWGATSLVAGKPVALLGAFETSYLQCPWVMAA